MTNVKMRHVLLVLFVHALAVMFSSARAIYHPCEEPCTWNKLYIIIMYQLYQAAYRRAGGRVAVPALCKDQGV